MSFDLKAPRPVSSASHYEPPDLIKLPCGCVFFDYGPSIRCAAHPGQDDCPHTWDPTNDGDRLIFRCTTCSETRGRA
jgi:hypothetical protein